MSLSAYSGYDALGLAALVKAREVPACELVEDAYARMDEVNPLLNAVVRTRREAALKEAAEMPVDGDDLTRPFAGVPFLLKDISQAIGGEPLTSGALLMKDNVAKRDSNYVARIRRGGFIPLGHTNTPEFGLKISPSPCSTARPAIPGTPPVHPAAPAAVRRQQLPPGSFRPPEPVTAAAPSAYRPRSPACSG